MADRIIREEAPREREVIREEDRRSPVGIILLILFVLFILWLIFGSGVFGGNGSGGTDINVQPQVQTPSGQ